MTLLNFDDRGLLPGIVQDAITGQVLMLGYLNEASIAVTRDSGLVTFWSRSRNCLWQKGSTSGNTLSFVSMSKDCDGDTVLIKATPTGPTCHTGALTCFGSQAEQGFAWIENLWKVIDARAMDRPTDSYTTSLLEGGVTTTGRKVVEEATEVLLAATEHAAGGASVNIAEESADLLYHLLVLLAERGIAPRDVINVLRSRAS